MRLILAGVLALAAVAALAGQSTIPPVVKPPVTTPVGPPRRPPATVTPKAIAAAEIHGRVVDSDGRAVADATVWLVGASTLARAASDARGRFTFNNVSSGEFVVIARKRGFYDGGFGKRRASGTPLPVTVAPGQAMSDLQIEMFRSGVITGFVFDEASEPVIGARVVAVRRFFSGGDWQYVPVAAVLTDDLGMYRVYGLEPGEYLVSTPTTQINIEVPDEPLATARLPHTQGLELAYPTLFYAGSRYSSLALPFLLTSGEVRHAVNFQWAPVPARSVSGRLTGEAERVSNQLVKLVPIEGREIGLGHEVAATSSAPDGAFFFERVPAGEYRLEAGGAFGPPKLVEIHAESPLALAPDFYFGRATVNVIDEDVKDLNVGMQPGYPAIGMIATPRGAGPLSRISIAIVPARPGLSRATSPAVVNGKFTSVPLIHGEYYVRVTGLPAGWYLKNITADGSDAMDLPVELGSLNTPDLVVSLTDRPTTISGSVRDSRLLPASGATVLVMPALASLWSPNRSRQTRASMNGQFTIAGLPSGEYLLVAFDDATAEGVQDERVQPQLRTLGTRVSLKDEESRTVQLRVSVIRR